MNTTEVLNQYKLCIDALIKEEKTRIAIYPYGFLGKQVLKLIEKNYVNIDYLLFDQNYDTENTKSPQLIDEYKEYHYLVTTIDYHIWEEVMDLLHGKGIKNDHIAFFLPRESIFIDDRVEKKLDVEFLNQIINNDKKAGSIVKSTKNQNLLVPNRDLIVSITSFPARIIGIFVTIKSIILQSKRPTKIILWLAEEEFPNKHKDLPISLIDLEHECSYFEIDWCDDIKSYKKLIPTLEKYPDAIVVTADDDIIYPTNWLANLWNTHIHYPTEIICHRITKIVKDSSQKWATVAGGHDFYDNGSYLNKLCGGGGTLYPIGSLHSDVFRRSIFMNIAPTGDDIWFWIMAVLKGTPIRCADWSIPYIQKNKMMKDTPALCNINDNNKKLFWKCFYNILFVYSQANDILEDELEKRKIPWQRYE